MDYQNWANEYLTEAEALRQRVAALREELKTASCNQANELNRRIAILYTMYLECRHTGQLLFDHPATRRQRTEQAEKEGIACGTNN